MIAVNMGLLVLLSISLSSGRSILAYLDPGTGSFLVQLLIGGLVGALVFLKAYWTKIRSFFGKRDQKQVANFQEQGQSKTDLDNEQN